MSQILRFRLVVLVFLVAGCAGAVKPVAGVPRNDAPAAAELVAKGKDAALRGDAVRAEQYFNLAVEQGADKGTVLPVLLRACLKSSHLRTALNHAEPYLLEHPEADALRYLVANIHLGLGQRVAARRELGLLLERNAHDADAHYLLGIIDADVDNTASKEHFLAAIRYTADEEQKVEVQSRLAELKLRERQIARAYDEVQP